MNTDPLTRVRAKQLARRMWDDGRGGWSIYAIHQYFNRRGLPVAESTVRRWAKPDYEQRESARVRRNSREQWGRLTDGRLGRRDNTPQFKLARAQALRDCGVPVGSIAKVMEFDFGDGLSEHQWRHILNRGAFPRSYERSAA